MGWGRLAGRLNEDPAIAFLNARAAGYRFQREVQSPDHPDHKAWEELNRPGPANMARKWLAGRKAVPALITRIRRDFPELESTLDPARVASWEGRPQGTRREWKINWTAIAVLMVLRLALILWNDTDAPKPPAQPPEISMSDTTREKTEAMVNTALARSMGRKPRWAGCARSSPIWPTV
jgi:hypothetical protein